MQQTAADPGVGHVFCLQEVAEAVIAGIFVQPVPDPVRQVRGDIQVFLISLLLPRQQFVIKYVRKIIAADSGLLGQFLTENGSSGFGHIFLQEIPVTAGVEGLPDGQGRAVGFLRTPVQIAVVVAGTFPADGNGIQLAAPADEGFDILDGQDVVGGGE